MFIPLNITVEKNNKFDLSLLFFCGPFTNFILILSPKIFVSLKNYKINLLLGLRNKFLLIKQKKYKNFFKKLIKLITASYIGLKRYIRIRGTGFSFSTVLPSVITINAGFSYVVNYRVIKNMHIATTRKFTLVRLHYKYLNTVNSCAAQIKQLRCADVYKGLGVYYRFEQLIFKKRRKQKSAR